jgi:hypothetical protein
MRTLLTWLGIICPEPQLCHHIMAINIERAHRGTGKGPVWRGNVRFGE